MGEDQIFRRRRSVDLRSRTSREAVDEPIDGGPVGELGRADEQGRPELRRVGREVEARHHLGFRGSPLATVITRWLYFVCLLTYIVWDTKRFARLRLFSQPMGAWTRKRYKRFIAQVCR